MAKGEKVEVPDYTTARKLGPNFAALVKERRDLSADIKVLTARFKEIADEITPMMIAAKVKSVAVDGTPVTLCTGHRTKIDGMRLLEKGVGSDIIQYATITTEYSYVTTGGSGGE